MRIFIFAIVCMVLAGCVAPNQTSITFYSSPPGATISTETRNFGTAPAEVIWTLPGPGARAVSEPVTATWMSGARASIRINLVAGQEGAYTFERPAGVAGLESDVQWAIHLQQQKAASQNSYSGSQNSSEACLYTGYGTKFKCFSSMRSCILFKNTLNEGGECH